MSEPTVPVPDSLHPEGLVGPSDTGTFFGPMSAVPTENWVFRGHVDDPWVDAGGDQRAHPHRAVEARRRDFVLGDKVHFRGGDKTFVVLAQAYNTVLWLVPADNQDASGVFTGEIANIELGPAPEPDPAPATSPEEA